MAIVVRKIKRAPSRAKAAGNSELPKEVVALVVMLAFCAIVADGEIADEELDSLRRIISTGFDTMLGQKISDEEVEGVIERTSSVFEELGYDGMMRSACETMAQSDDLKRTALIFVATVIMSDGDYDPEGSESSYYDDLAEMLAVDEEVSVAIWNETAESFE